MTILKELFQLVLEGKGLPLRPGCLISNLKVASVHSDLYTFERLLGTIQIGDQIHSISLLGRNPHTSGQSKEQVEGANFDSGYIPSPCHSSWQMIGTQFIWYKIEALTHFPRTNEGIRTIEGIKSYLMSYLMRFMHRISIFSKSLHDVTHDSPTSLKLSKQLVLQKEPPRIKGWHLKDCYKIEAVVTTVYCSFLIIYVLLSKIYLLR